MTWRDQLRPASFRGVPFLVFGWQSQHGRRAETHEYPRRNLPYSEDLGRKARPYTFDAFVLAPDYPAVADQLIAALEADGPGTLVHPRFGEISVVALPSACNENPSAEGGMARFSLNFVEAGDRALPKVATNTAATVSAQATNASSAVQTSFAKRFSTTGQVSSVVSSAQSSLSGALSTLNTITNKLDLSGAISSLAHTNGATSSLLSGGSNLKILGQISQLKSQLSTLMGTPASLGAAIAGIIGSFQGLTGIGGEGFGSFGIPGLTGSRYSGSSAAVSVPPAAVTNTTAGAATTATAAGGTASAGGSSVGVLTGTGYSTAGGSPSLALADSYPSAAITALAPTGLVTTPPTRTITTTKTITTETGATVATQTTTTTTASGLVIDPAATAVPVPASDPTYAPIVANQTAVSDLIRQSALVVAVQDAAATTYTSQDDALAARDNVTSRLDAEILTTPDDTVADALRDLRVAIVRDLTDRASSLPSLMTVTPTTTLPALLLAFQLYDDPDEGTDIVARNNVTHPGFLPVQALTVLSYEETSNG